MSEVLLKHPLHEPICDKSQNIHMIVPISIGKEGNMNKSFEMIRPELKNREK